jgi:hypothetical protein
MSMNNRERKLWLPEKSAASFRGSGEGVRAVALCIAALSVICMAVLLVITAYSIITVTILVLVAGALAMLGIVSFLQLLRNTGLGAWTVIRSVLRLDRSES